MEEIKYEFYVNNDIEKTLLNIICNSNLNKHKCAKIIDCECEPYGLILVEIYYQISKIKLNKSPKYFNIFKLDLNLPYFTNESCQKQQINDVVKFIFSEKTSSIYDFLCIFYEKPQINISINLSKKIGHILIKQSNFNDAKNHLSYYLFYSALSNNHNCSINELVSIYSLIFECILKLNKNFSFSYLKILMMKEIKQVSKNKELYEALITEINKIINNLNKVNIITTPENDISKDTFGYNSYNIYIKRLEYASSKITMIHKQFLKFSIFLKREVEKKNYFKTQNDILGRVTEIMLNKNIILILIALKLVQLLKLVLKNNNINLISPKLVNLVLNNSYIKTIADVISSFYKIIIIN